MYGFRQWFSEAKTGFDDWWKEGHFQDFICGMWKSRWYIAFVAVVIGLMSICSPSTSEQPVAVTHEQVSTRQAVSREVQEIREHIVRRGEFLIAIAKSYHVPWEAVMLLNEHELQKRAEKRCGKLSERYTERKRGYYCNTTRTFRGQSVVHANSLQPKDVIRIPSVASPREIEQAIQNVSGNRIVIDDTGSMDDDRQRVGAWYASAIQKSGKFIVKVILYADGSIREYSAGQVEFYTSGTRENTFAALERAASYRPDTIVLISDEPGDDWPHSLGRLPPIIAHSLDSSADRNLEWVARRTGGQFIQMHSNSSLAVVP